MSPVDKHLSDEQIDWLVAHEQGEIHGGPPQESLQEALRHLAGCLECQQIVSLHINFERNLRKLRETGGAGSSQECPPLERLRAVAAGIKSDEESEKVLDHAAHCDYCGPLLREATKDFASDLTSEEESVLAQLPSSQREIQRKLGRRLAAAQRPADARPRLVLPRALERLTAALTPTRWIYAAAGLITLVAIGSWLAVRSTRPSADLLLAQAYSEQRTLELRFADARQAPIRQQRGPGESPLAKPAALLEAELLIKRELVKTPNDPRWLAAKGRSELLEWRYEDAIHTFGRALETNPDSPDVLRDLATAHFQRAEIEKRPIDYGSAIQELSQALAKRPSDPVGLFNRAIIYERMFLYENATKDWETYLKLDPGGPWSTEARQHLDDVKKKQLHHDQSQKIPIGEPSAANNLLEERLRHTADKDQELDSIDEEYLDLATEKWLSGLAEDLRRGLTLSQSPSGRALHALSELWLLRHGDSWLSDLLESANTRGFPAAAESLAKAISAGSEGNPSLSLEQAQLAVQRFDRFENRAGVFRAKLEGIYALQRSLEDERCVAAARKLDADLASRSYFWMKGKLLLEQAACAASGADVADADRLLHAADQIAVTHNFGALYLRGLSFASDFAADKGDSDLSWKNAQQGLQQFWSGSYPPIRGYALCASLGYVAEDSEQAWTAMAFWSEAIPFVERTANRSTEGLARYRLATEEVAVGRNAEANEEFVRVTRIFSALPSSSATLNYRVASEVSLAAIESSVGERAAARKRLNEIAAYVRDIDQYQTALQYYRTLGEEQALDGDLQAAEKSLQSAVAIAQLGMRTLASDAERINWDQQTGNTYRSLIRLLISQPGRETEALRVWELYRSLVYQSPGQFGPSTRSTLAQLGAQAPRPGELDVHLLLPSLTNVTFLTYAQLGNEIAFWAFDDRGIFFRKVVAPINEFIAVSKRFSRLCSDPESDNSLRKSDGQKLYTLLISPMQDFLSEGRILWVETDGILSLVPFQALVGPDGVPLLGKFAVAYRSSAQTASHSQEPRVLETDRALVASSSLLAPPSSLLLPPVRDAATEAEAVAARFPNHRLFLGEEKNLEMIRAEFRKAALFHYAGHYLPARGTNQAFVDSVLDTQPNRASRLGFSRRPALARCKLVVLSACSTGSADQVGLFDPAGLVHPFLRSGARRVIASRWDVDSNVTAHLMDRFYSALLSGQTIVEALRTASRGLASDPRYSHPFYWAAFAVFAQD